MKKIAWIITFTSIDQDLMFNYLLSYTVKLIEIGKILNVNI